MGFRFVAVVLLLQTTTLPQKPYRFQLAQVLSNYLIIIIFLASFVGFQPSPVLAIVPCMAHQPAQLCYPAFGGQGPVYLRIVHGVPFIWFRAAPNSNAQVVGKETPQQGGVYIVL